jgi:hypothetical protein
MLMLLSLVTVDISSYASQIRVDFVRFCKHTYHCNFGKARVLYGVINSDAYLSLKHFKLDIQC